jgi:hypothetical protein
VCFSVHKSHSPLPAVPKDRMSIDGHRLPPRSRQNRARIYIRKTAVDDYFQSHHDYHFTSFYGQNADECLTLEFRRMQTECRLNADALILREWCARIHVTCVF